MDLCDFVCAGVSIDFMVSRDFVCAGCVNIDFTVLHDFVCAGVSIDFMPLCDIVCASLSVLSGYIRQNAAC